MIDYCYVSKYQYVSNSELNFINALREFKKVEVLILDRSRIKNYCYLFIINLSLRIELYFQSRFKISRNFLNGHLVKVESNLNNRYLDISKVDKYVYLNKFEFVFSEMKSLSFYKSNVGSLIKSVGRNHKNLDQNNLSIKIIAKDKNEIIFSGNYERDKFDLNNKFISIRRVLHYALYIAKNN